MRLVSYGVAGAERPGMLDDDDNIVVLDHYFNRLGLPPLDVSSMIGLVPFLCEDLERELLDPRVVLPAGSVRLGPPVPNPANIIGIGMNYARPGRTPARLNADGFRTAPPIFSKPRSALVGACDPVVAPRTSHALDYEVEIAIVIGKGGSRIRAEHAGAHIGGFMVVNDMTAHDVMMNTDDLSNRMAQPAMKAQLLVGKGFDGFLPCGPWLVTADAGWAQERTLSLSVNGELRQSDTTAAMILSFEEVIELISRFTTLRTGDIIMTGTPLGGAITMESPNYLTPGDLVSAAVGPDLGALSTEIVASTDNENSREAAK